MRLTIYRKFLLVLIPVFAAMAGAGLLILSRIDTQVSSEALAMRVGNLAGRISGALSRPTVLANVEIADDFLGTFGTDSAVLCAELHGTSKPGARMPSYPPVVGCKGVEASTTMSLPVGEDGALLVISYTDEEINRAAHRRSMLTLVVLLAALLATLASASLGFRLIVGKRLALLHAALHRSANPGQRTHVNPGRQDELAEIIRAYNSLMRSEQEREAALTEKNQRLDDASRRDPMTGLYNRRHFEEWVSDFNGETVLRQLTGVIGLIDVDYFKSINDTYGHGVGDEVLVTLAKRLSKAMRTGDFLVRWGGEEILIYVAEHQNIEAIARRVLSAATGRPVSTTVGELQITASMGLARLPLSAGDFFLSIDRAITLADSALYVAKGTGRNRAICIHAVHVQHPSELEDLEADLKLASENHLVHLGTVIPDERIARKQGTFVSVST